MQASLYPLFPIRDYTKCIFLSTVKLRQHVCGIFAQGSPLKRLGAHVFLVEGKEFIM